MGVESLIDAGDVVAVSGAGGSGIAAIGLGAETVFISAVGEVVGDVLGVIVIKATPGCVAGALAVVAPCATIATLALSNSEMKNATDTRALIRFIGLMTFD